MALLMIILRKMIKNRVYIIFLTIGLLLSSALLSAIPMYTGGSLNKLLTKELESYQQSGKQSDLNYPGALVLYYSPLDDAIDKAVKDLDPSKSMFEIDKVNQLYAKKLAVFQKVDTYAKNNVLPKTAIGAEARYADYAISPRKLTGLTHSVIGSDQEACTLESLTDIEKHIQLIDGRLSEKTGDGVYEVLVTDTALAKLRIVLGRIYTLSDYRANGFADIKVKPVGSFTVKNERDPYWSYFTPDCFSQSMLLSEDTMLSDFINKQPTQISNASWYYALDYHAISIYNAGEFLSGVTQIKRDLHNLSSETSVVTPVNSLVGNYYDKKQQLTGMMWSLNVFVITVLCLYMFMISTLIIERERNEISMLSSRGAGRVQIAAGYLIEGLLLGAVALLLGPLLGYVICSLLGSSSEFMQFVNRKGMPLRIMPVSFAYALLAVLVFLITLLATAVRADATILEHKRSLARKKTTSWWNKIFFDFVLLGISAYGCYVFNQRQEVLALTGISASDVSIDPLLFLVPLVFIFGISLLFLRIYPNLVKLVLLIGRRHWRPPIYLAITQVGRSPRSYDFLMIFLILTLSTGIFSANSARTINQNAQERIYYGNGADMVLQIPWSAANPPKTGPTGQSVNQAGDQADLGKEIQEVTRTIYIEPDYQPFTKLAGVQQTAKVYVNDSAEMSFQDKNAGNITLMAIQPYDFGQVVWYRSGLLPHHINEYLNLMASQSSSCLISRSISSAYGINVGDSISVGYTGTSPAVLNVYGIVDCWPSWNPNRDTSVDRGRTGDPMLIVGNLDYIHNLLGVDPYQVWMKLEPGATSKEVYDSMTKNNIYPQLFRDSKQQVIQLKNGPFQMAINGSLTMGFLISGIICFMGFVLFWMLSLRARVLQFGVLRAMGLSSGQFKMMILWEQLLTSGAAVVVGMLTGFATSDVYIPFFQIFFDSTAQVPLFRVVSYPGDIQKVLIFVGVTMLTGISVLVYMFSRIKISNVIKLGED